MSSTMKDFNQTFLNVTQCHIYIRKIEYAPTKMLGKNTTQGGSDWKSLKENIWLKMK